MPRCRKRKTERGSWSSEARKAAIGVVEAGIPIRQAAVESKIPFSTIQQRLKTGDNSQPKMGRKPVFTVAQEAALAEIIKKLAILFYGQIPLQVRCAAFEFAERYNIPNDFNKEKRCAGMDWFYGFQARNPSVSVRKPEATSLNRVMAFNPETVKVFFDNLKTVMDGHNFSPSQIFNMDGTGITTVQQPQSVVAAKGQKRLGAITSGERGRTVTVVCAVSAAGIYVPPMFIFPRQRMATGLSADGPVGAIYHCSKNGWTTAELFLVWLKHFVEVSKCTEEKPVLLVLDNHASHISLESYEFCREHGIVMVSLPPHTSHRLQPLDVTFFGPFKAAFRKESDNMMKAGPLRRITEYDLASLFNKAYTKVASIEKGVSGFQLTGICPFNPNIIRPEDFVANSLLPTVNSNLLSSQNITTGIQPPLPTALDDITSLPPSIITDTDTTFNIDELPILLVDSSDGTGENLSLDGDKISFHSSLASATQGTTMTDSPLPDIGIIAPFMLPKEDAVTEKSELKRTGRKKQQSIIITSSPMKDKLEAQKRNRKIKEEKLQQKSEGARKRCHQIKSDKENEKPAKKETQMERNEEPVEKKQRGRPKKSKEKEQVKEKRMKKPKNQITKVTNIKQRSK